MSIMDVHGYRAVPCGAVETSCRELGMQPLPTKESEFVQVFLASLLRSKDLEDGVKQLRNRVVLLDPTFRKGKGKYYACKRLTCQQKKKLHVSPWEQRFETFIPLHHLWRGYVEELLGPDQERQCSSNPSQVCLKLTKADYHGCLLKVTQSKCPSYVGVEGIVVMETQNTLQLICRSSQYKTIPKPNSVFSFELYGHLFSIHGNRMLCKAGERSAKKFKDKASVDL